MSEFELSGPIIHFSAWLTQSVVNLLLQSTALILIGLFAAWVMRRRGSAVQSAIYRATLVTVFVCPIAAFALGSVGLNGWTIQMPQITRTISYRVESPYESPLPKQSSTFGGESIQPVDGEQLATVADRIDFGFGDTGAFASNGNSDNGLTTAPLDHAYTDIETVSSENAPPIMMEKSVANTEIIAIYILIGTIWLLGTVLLLTRLLFAYRRLAQMRRQSLRADGLEISICQQLANDIQVPTPDVRRNSLLSSPCLTGITSPVILLPAEIKEPIPLEKAFTHELAHLRRHDTLWNLIQRIAVALFFYQPLMWRLVYRLETTAEEVCDDFVVRHCMDRAGYAQQLVDLAESNLLAPNLAGLGMFNSRSLLGHRIVRILDTTRQLTTRVSAPIVASIAMLALFAAMLAGLIGSSSNRLAIVEDQTDKLAKSEVDDETLVKVSGRALDHNGNPVGEATIKVMPSVFHHYPKKISGPYTTTISRSDGSFEAEFPQSKLLESGHQRISREKNFTIVATKPGHGMNWSNATDMTVHEASATSAIQYEPVDIQMVTDQTPLRLTIVDTEGNPVPKAKVKIDAVQTMKNNDLTLLIRDAKSGKNFPEVVKHLEDYLAFHGLPEYEANDQGELIITGIGDNRIVDIQINGSSIVSTAQKHMLLDHEPLVFNYGGMITHKIIYNGANSTTTCEPTQPIIGQVIDSKTKQPMAGVLVISSGFAGTRIAGTNRLETISDQDGRFRLIGMPKGPGNSIAAIPNDEQPYFMMRFDVPGGAGLNPVEMTLELERGTWIRGKALDKKSGDPIVGARLYYLPFLSNDLASRSSVYRDGQHMEIQSRYLTNDDGSFQLVGLPGKAVVGILDVQGKYPAGMGWEDIDENEKDSGKSGHVRTFRRPITPFRKWPTAMKQVEIDGNASEHRVNFDLDSGMTIPLKIVSANGEAITGATFRRLRSPNDYSFTNSDALVSAGGLKKDEKRQIHVELPQRNLSRVFELDASKFDPAENLEPKLIELLPNSTVTGRLVDKNGEPVVGGSIEFHIGGGGQGFGMRLPIVTTDKDGEFRHDAVSPGAWYYISCEVPDDIGSVSERLEVPIGELIDLGTINLSTEDRPKPKRAPLSAVPQSTSTQSNRVKGTALEPSGSRQSADEQEAFSGVVVDSNDKPVSGATIHHGLDFQTTSDSRGMFSIKIPKSKLSNQPNYGTPFNVRKKGFGDTLTRVTAGQRKGIRLTLVNDSHPIIGKLIDTEGNPVQGASVTVERIIQFGDYAIEELAEKANSSTARIQLPGGGRISMPEIPAAVSNENGDFEIKGIGYNRIAHITIIGENVAIQKAVVATTKAREIKNLDAHWGSLDGSATPVRGSQPTFICEPSQPIEGVVVDRETELPLANVEVTSYSFAGPDPRSRLVGSQDLKTTTDGQGRFRLVGMPNHPGNQILVYPNLEAKNAQPYISQVFEVTDAQGIDSIVMKLGLQRGAWIRGKVVDQDTGKPLRQVRVSYQPAFDNETAQQLDGDQGVGPGGVGPQTDKEGKFKLVGVPGVGFVNAIVHLNSDYPFGQGWRDIDTERKSKIRYPMHPRNSTGIKEISLAENGADKISIELSKGKNVRIKTMTSDGEPVSGVTVSYLPVYIVRAFRTDTAEFDAPGFIAGESRTMVFQSLDKKLGTIAKVNSDDSSPVVVTLEPVAKFKASLVQSDGQPAAGKSLEFGFLNKDDRILWRVRPTNPSDKDGHVDQPLLPGKYVVSISTPNGFSGYKKFELKSGEELDLGKVDISQKFAVHVMSDPMSNPIQQLPTLKPDKPRSEKQSPRPKSTKEPRDKNSDRIEIRGTVVDDNNQPIENADVQVRLRYRPETMPQPIAIAKTNNRGEFRLEYSGDVTTNRPKLQQDEFYTTVRVTADGYVRNWLDTKDIFQNNDQQVVIKLSKEFSHSVYHLVDPEGNPIRGNASIQIKSIAELGDIKQYEKLRSAKERGNHFKKSPKRTFQPGDKNLVFETNDEGQIELVGVGANRLFWVHLRGEQVANQYFYLATGLTQDISYIDDDQSVTIHAHGSKIVCETGQTITGVVRDSKTKLPIPNVDLIGYGSAARSFSVRGIYSARSDNQGRYKITGAGIGEGNTFYAVANSNEPYLARHFEIPTLDRSLTGDGSIQKFDVELHPGNQIKILVTDAATGLPISNAKAFYTPLRSNPINELFPEHRWLWIMQSVRGEQPLTNAKGECVLSGMPGQGIVGVRIEDPTIRTTQGWRDVTRKLGNTAFPAPIQGYMRDNVTSRHHVSIRDTAIQLVEIQEADQTTVCHFKIDRTPNTKKQFSGRVKNFDGQPVSGATVRFNVWKREPNREIETVVETLTNRQGDFKLSIDQPLIDELDNTDQRIAAAIVVRAEDQGSRDLFWNEIDPDKLLNIQLETENTRSGRVIDVEGEPAVGPGKFRTN